METDLQIVEFWTAVCKLKITVMLLAFILTKKFILIFQLYVHLYLYKRALHLMYLISYGPLNKTG